VGPLNEVIGNKKTWGFRFCVGCMKRKTMASVAVLSFLVLFSLAVPSRANVDCNTTFLDLGDQTHGALNVGPNLFAGSFFFFYFVQCDRSNEGKKAIFGGIFFFLTLQLFRSSILLNAMEV
jgi:hypothetical protein